MGWGVSFIENPKSTTGVDISFEAVEEAKRRYGRLAIFQVGSMERLKFPNGCFDLVSCLEGIEHVSIEIGRGFVSEVLREDGLFLISSPDCHTQENSGNPYHVHEYRPDEIMSLLESHFLIQEIEERKVDNLTALYVTCKKRPEHL